MNVFRGCAFLGVWLLLAGVSYGKQVYLRDGGIVQCESFWRSGNAVLVKVNRDEVLTFERNEVDVSHTFRNVPHKVKVLSTKAPPGHASRPEAAPVAKAAGTPAVASPEKGLPPAVAPAASAATPATTPAAVPASKPASPLATPPPATTTAAAQPQATKPATTRSPNPQAERLKMAIEAQKRASAAPVIPAFGMTTLLAFFACLLLCIASMWRVFVKAGQSGVNSLIPIYNLFILMEISGKPWWWLFLLFVPVVGVAVGVLSNISLAAKFGKGLVFGLGLSFLPMFFLPLLAFGEADYQG